jgi:hypothetical protein
MTCATEGCAEPRGAQCHCAGCHFTFTAIRPFDLHQRISKGSLTCLNPRYARDRNGKLIFREIRIGAWGMNAEHSWGR